MIVGTRLLGVSITTFKIHEGDTCHHSLSRRRKVQVTIKTWYYYQVRHVGVALTLIVFRPSNQRTSTRDDMESNNINKVNENVSSHCDVFSLRCLATPVACGNSPCPYNQTYTEGQKSAQMLRDICGWLTINSMRAEKVWQRFFSRVFRL